MKYSIITFVLLLFFGSPDKTPLVNINGVIEGGVTLYDLRTHRNLASGDLSDLQILSHRVIIQSFDKVISGGVLPIQLITKHWDLGDYLFITDIVAKDEAGNKVALNSLFLHRSRITKPINKYKYELSQPIKSLNSISRDSLLALNQIPITNKCKESIFRAIVANPKFDERFYKTVIGRSFNLTQGQGELIKTSKAGDMLYIQHMYSISETKDTINLTPFYLKIN